MVHLDTLSTEQSNPNSYNIDAKNTIEILQIINNEDHIIPGAIKKELGNISVLVDAVVESFKGNGRLFYVGAGTSGRLGMLDAAECPPTFGTDKEMVQGIIAGDNKALTQTVEWIEDSETAGEKAIEDKCINSKDIVIAISASGHAPFVMGAMKKAKEKGAKVGLIICNTTDKYFPNTDIIVPVDVGPEILTGSTRMKSGTAQKMVLNMITTASMIKMGKVYNNLMVDLMPVNKKLIHRSKTIIRMATDCNKLTADRAFTQSGNKPKTAILMILLNIGKDEAEFLLNQNEESISLAVQKFKGQK
jgi:N-acetylmuramic acid 6-phosphate etherase